MVSLKNPFCYDPHPVHMKFYFHNTCRHSPLCTISTQSIFCFNLDCFKCLLNGPCFCLPFLPVPPPQLFSAHQTEGFFKNGNLITTLLFCKHSNITSRKVRDQFLAMFFRRLHYSVLPPLSSPTLPKTCWLHMGLALTSMLFSQMAAWLTFSFLLVFCSNIASVVRSFLIPKSTLNYQSLTARLKHHHFFS